MSAAPVDTPKDPWFRGSILLTVALFIVSAVLGFVVLPLLQPNLGPRTIWQMICSAAGVLKRPSSVAPAEPDYQISKVVVKPGMLEEVDEAAIGRGATVAHQCAICHGPEGVSGTNFPNLAGQYAEVTYKELNDFKSGARVNATMSPFAQVLTDRDMRDVATFYASLPKPRSVGQSPVIVTNGAPLRNIPPCGACHGEIAHKVASPWLDGQPANYIEAQLKAFASGSRRNDTSEQMRNIARGLTPQEIEDAANYYATLAHATKLTNR
jgi:cytochrome c553